MFEGLFGLQRNQKMYLHGALLAPAFVVWLVLFQSKDGLTALLALQLICYLLAPFIYIRYLSKEREIKIYFLNELRNRSEQVRNGFWGFVGATGILFSMYFFIYEFRYPMLMSLDIPITINAPYLITFAIFFIFVNPVLEELFWRLFMLKTFKDNDFNKSLVIFHYALYHVVVLLYIMEWKTAFLMVFTYFSIGKSLEYIKYKYGLISAILTHFGLSLGFALIFLDVIYSQTGLKHQNQSVEFPSFVPLYHNHTQSVNSTL